MKSIYEEYAEYICSTCKGKCDKEICIIEHYCKEDKNYKEIKCYNYIKDESKIKRIEPELQVTARRTKNFDRLFQ